ncbi:MAG: NADP-dependent oxidoreductase, partial [Betaproteobacteria bacterium]|nr:NADP-dependent oxidoreductase [Betaproteobacteria bacterium]
MTIHNRRIVLAARPRGVVTSDCFRIEDQTLGSLESGQVLVRNHYMSLDPYMRGRMDDAKSYAAPQAIGQTMQGATVGVVEQSNNPQFVVGDSVVGMFGWQHYGLSDGRGITKIDTSKIPMSAFIGVMGMPGATAWYGLNRIIDPKPGETIVVSAAAGAVGAVVGQLAKFKACRVVGVAGGAEKCQLVTETFGFDACIDYKAGRLYEDLAAATPDGIDGNFENVGGPVLDAVLRRMNGFGRIAVCGLIAGYNGEDIALKSTRSILVNRLKVQGFIISEHLGDWPKAHAEIGQAIIEGRLLYKETVAEGLEQAPEAFIG